MRRIAFALLFLALSACVSAPATPPPSQLSPPTDEMVKSVMEGRAQLLRIHMKDGSKLPPLSMMRDFGDAVCGDYCLWRRDIDSFEWQGGPKLEKPNYLVEAPVLVLASPIIAPYAFALWNSERKEQNLRQTELKARLVGAATPERMKRIWLDNLSLRDGKLYRGETNACLASHWLPEDFADDAAALDWVWTNRLAGRNECLSSAANGFAVQAGAANHERAMRLWALAAVQLKWGDARCAATVQLFALAPPTMLDLSRGHGDPRVLDVIAETLAGEDGFPSKIDPSVKCPGGLRPDADWPRLKASVRSAGPFLRQAVRIDR